MDLPVITVSTTKGDSRPPSRDSKHKRNKSDSKLEEGKDKETQEHSHQRRARSKSKPVAVEIKTLNLSVDKEKPKSSNLLSPPSPTSPSVFAPVSPSLTPSSPSSPSPSSPSSLSPLRSNRDDEIDQMKMQLKAMLMENQMLAQQISGNNSSQHVQCCINITLTLNTNLIRLILMITLTTDLCGLCCCGMLLNMCIRTAETEG